mgnify:CR=1 FL=1
MGHGGTDHEREHAHNSGEHYFHVAMMAKTEPERDDTQRQYDDEHLHMQVPLRELRQKWQPGHEQRQGEAVNQTQCRQADRRAIEPAGRFRHTLIHSEMPLSYQRPGRYMDKRLLAILRCPVTHKELSLAKSAKLREVNQAIDAGELSNRDGRVLETHLAEALITDDGKVLYPIANGIPILLEGESVNMEQLG